MIIDPNIAVIVGTEAFGDWRLGMYAKDNGLLDMFLGYASYFVAVTYFIQSIKAKGLAWSNSEWDAWSNLASGAVAIFLLGEKPSWKELAGMAFVFLGLFLLGTKGTK
jgi:drug/metabolite transporter (DMT)-like permease